MAPSVVRNLELVLNGVAEHWSPRTVAVVNDYDVRVVKVKGEFTAHRVANCCSGLVGLVGPPAATACWPPSRNRSRQLAIDACDTPRGERPQRSRAP